MNVRHYECFSELIKAVRRRNQLSQRALAKALNVSAGYVGQWELRLSQPSPDVTVKLCRRFKIEDIEYVQRLAYAGRAPEWLRESIINYARNGDTAHGLSSLEERVVRNMRRLSESAQQRLADRIDGWIDATLETEETGAHTAVVGNGRSGSAQP